MRYSAERRRRTLKGVEQGLRKGPIPLISTVERAGTKPAGFAPEPSRGSAAGLRRLAALTLLALLAFGAGMKVRQDEALSRLVLGAARQENRALFRRQEALREKLFEASRRLEALELGEPIDSDRRWREARLNRGRGIT